MKFEKKNKFINILDYILIYFLPVFFPGLFLCVSLLIIVYLQFCILL